MFFLQAVGSTMELIESHRQNKQPSVPRKMSCCFSSEIVMGRVYRLARRSASECCRGSRRESVGDSESATLILVR